MADMPRWFVGAKHLREAIAQCHIDRLNSFRSDFEAKDLIQMRR
jgi:hypothetical protein